MSQLEKIQIQKEGAVTDFTALNALYGLHSVLLQQNLLFSVCSITMVFAPDKITMELSGTSLVAITFAPIRMLLPTRTLPIIAAARTDVNVVSNGRKPLVFTAGQSIGANDYLLENGATFFNFCTL